VVRTLTEDDLIEEHYRKVLQHLIAEFGDCLDCGICCRFPTVGVSQHEIGRIAKYLDMGAGAFRRKYITAVEGKQVLKHQEGGSEDCIFLGENNKCKIYSERPYPCWTFPFDVQLKKGEVQIRYIETCVMATNFFSGFMEFIKKYYPHTHATVSKTLDAEKPQGANYSSHITFPNVLINQYMFWLLMEDRDGY